jgi:magnesium transporter
VDTEKIFDQILGNLDTVITQDSPLGILLWQEFLKIHPADIAQFLGNIDKQSVQRLFILLPQALKLEVFSYLSYPMRVFCLSFLNDQDRGYLLGSLPIDKLTDFLDDLSDDELKKYLKLLHKRDREKVLSLMQFNSESAGGIMDTDVLTLMADLTIEKSIQILQRLQPKIEFHRQIYVTNQDNELIGHINLEDLVLKPPKTRLSSILRKNELVVTVDEDREAIAHKMVHYNLMTVPVVGDSNVFLGLIPSDTLVDILEREAAEDVYKISALTPIKYTYFETPFFHLFYQRGSILAILLLLQVFSSMILEHYNALLEGFLIFFNGMIQSTGGNTSSQTSALVIQGITSGEISEANIKRFLWREFLMACLIGLTLAVVAFIRIYITHPGHLWGNVAVSLSLGIIVLVSVMLGSIIPFLLKKLNLDPASAAGPFLATLMDVLGLLIYCTISTWILC